MYQRFYDTKFGQTCIKILHLKGRLSIDRNFYSLKKLWKLGPPFFEAHSSSLPFESSLDTNEVYIIHPPRLVTEHRSAMIIAAPLVTKLQRYIGEEKKKKGKKAKKKEGKGGGESEGTDRFIVCNRERVEARRPIRFSRFFHQTKMIPRRADNARENTRLEIEGTQNMRIHNNLFAASAFCLLSALESRPSLRRGSLMQNSRVIRGYMFKNPCVSPRPCARLPQSLPVQPVSQRIL